MTCTHFQDDYLTAYSNPEIDGRCQRHTGRQFNGGPFYYDRAGSHGICGCLLQDFARSSEQDRNPHGGWREFITDVEWPSGFRRCLFPIQVFGARFTTKAFKLWKIWPTSACSHRGCRGRAHVHSEYALLANVVVASEGATFEDVAPGAGVTPGDGIFTIWSYRAGAGRAEAFLLNPQPLSASTSQTSGGVVAEVVPNGKASPQSCLSIGRIVLKEGSRSDAARYARVHFIRRLKERLVRELGGLSLGQSSADLVKSKNNRKKTSS